ncbi:very-long-chain (3R)-3-hydroxyacyl-CoA dehydratase isoform X3 [Salmo trutta]|uniref:very-long-chain (3R)-3-hydroxyacyl-CoA dehydratase isoform X3 n=1 Tax=Salmo trutta TaxID=8032 RepID=UPI0011313436|nr:very-long-chain (3R)-3-hydroxyacyl-CoA dehydratase-like isoform X3 [Salmo trutta]
MQTLTPHVYWAQRHGDIYLRVELSDAKNLDICVQDNTLQFKAQGHGAKGDNDYEFSLDFLEPVKPEVSHRSTQRLVNVTVRKQEQRWWDRLTLQERKPLFLAPDFDRWLDESDAEMELQAKVVRTREEEKINKVSIESRIRKDPYLGLKKGYLFMYNLVQFLGFSWIFVNMTVRLFILGQDSFYDTFHTIADMMYFCQMMAVAEVINPLVGLVKTGVFPAMIQSGGDAEQSSGLLRLLPLEHHRDLQVSILHAGLHRHRLEAADLAQILHLDAPLPSGGASRGYSCDPVPAYL